MKKKSLGFAFFLGLLLTVPIPAAEAATHTVNSTKDDPDALPGDGTCATVLGECTLRAAIEEVNAPPNGPADDTIDFNIPATDPGCVGQDWCTISLTNGDLPTLIDPKTHINGTTQTDTNMGDAGSGETPGVAEGNTCSALLFPKPDVAIDGNDFNAFRFGANDMTVEGLAIYDTAPLVGGEARFAVRADSPTTGHMIRKMFIGLLPDGTQPLPDAAAIPPDPEQRNKGFGINIRGDASATARESLVGHNGIGGIIGEPNHSTMVVEQNEVFQNGWNDPTRDGIDFNGDDSICRCNLTYQNTSTAALPRGDTGNGIEVGSRDAPGDFANNIIEYNTSRDNLSAGVSVRKGTFGNTLKGNVVNGNQIGVSVYTEGTVLMPITTNRNLISRNSIFQNLGMGIDLENVATGLPWTTSDDGTNPNDDEPACDSDTGANDKQNHPVLTSASSAGANTNVQGSLTSIPGHTFRIEFFATPFTGVFNPADPQGKIFIGETTLTLDSGCTKPFNENFPMGFDEMHYITATATDITPQSEPLNNTSEFSPPLQVHQIGPGKVTGGGSIDDSSFVCNAPSCTVGSSNRANFGVNAKYRHDMTGPEGHTNFKYSPGKLHLNSTSYVPGSLVITEMPPGDLHATWEGQAKVNQEKSPSHCFRVQVTDRGEPGTTDSFRIKIWKGTGSGATLDCSVESNVVYDNLTEETLRSGNIQVHTNP